MNQTHDLENAKNPSTFGALVKFFLLFFVSQEMWCLGSQSQPAWGLMGHITGARTGPKQLLLLHHLLSALIPPLQTI